MRMQNQLASHAELYIVYVQSVSNVLGMQVPLASYF